MASGATRMTSNASDPSFSPFALFEKKKKVLIASLPFSPGVRHFPTPFSRRSRSAMPADSEIEDGHPASPSAQTPLLDGAATAASVHANPLDLAIRRVELFLSALGFLHQSLSPLALLFCCSGFLILGVAVPVVSVFFSSCLGGGCEDYEVGSFELFVVVCEVALAVASLACVSLNLRKYGMRRFLFVDHSHGQLEKFRREYTAKLQAFFYLLFWWILPCFFVKTAREILRFLDAEQDSLWESIVILVSSIVSWTYLTAIYSSGCALFNLVCNLQIIHFEDLSRHFETDIVVIKFLEEHVCLHHYLSKISHRFRIYLLLIFLFVTISQVVMLFEMTGYSGIVNFTTAGDFAVSSVVQVVGITVCLHSAAKISHRAQGIASLASKWHALITCSSPESSELRFTNSCGNLSTFISGSLVTSNSESDLESLDNVAVQTRIQLTSYLSSYQTRESLVTYLQGNPGGITIFGWTVDRGLITTIFFMELSLVLFVLGTTIVFPRN